MFHDYELSFLTPQFPKCFIVWQMYHWNLVRRKWTGEKWGIRYFSISAKTRWSHRLQVLLNSNRLPTGIFKSSARKYRKPVCFQNITINISRRFHWYFAVSFLKDTSSGIYALHKKIKFSIKDFFSKCNQIRDNSIVKLFDVVNFLLL